MDPSRLVAVVLKSGRVLQRFLGGAVQQHLVVLHLKRIGGDDDILGSHAEKAADRENRVGDFTFRRDDQIVDAADGFAGIIDDGAADDLRRPVAGGKRRRIDLGQSHGLRSALGESLRRGQA